MKIKLILALLIIGYMNQVKAQDNLYGLFKGQNDIGDVKIQGSVSYDPETDEYIVGGSGENIWFSRDEFNFVWQVIDGDFILYAQMEFIPGNTEPHRKGGWMVRQGLDDNAPYVDAIVHGDGLTSMQFREKINGETAEVAADVKGPAILQLERRGNTFIMSSANPGEPLREVARKDQILGSSVYVGLISCAHNENNFQQIRYNNVRISVPATIGKENSREGVTSRMEILDIETLHRKTIYEEKSLFEAPNWSHSEPSLIYNGNGKLYKLPISGGSASILNTDFAQRLNNDHGISPDGKWIAISNGDDGIGSRVYVVPYKGGKPKLVTEKGPSYWHGWSADSKTLAYVGGRQAVSEFYDIYTISIKGGDESRITTADCLDDGPDYTLDGKYIYFNSCRSGTMQIWRMKPDGSDQEQITHDEYQDWFPHPSPDGKWIAFISYFPDVAAGSHPPNKQVMLRLMPVGGGDIKVIAHLYGGQGSFNVPSWSPDSKKIAFVSYTF